MLEVIEFDVEVVCSSPKSQSYVSMVPSGEEELDPSKKTVEPLIDEVKEAVGAWSGMMATPRGAVPVEMVETSVFGKIIGRTTVVPRRPTYAFFPSGVMAMPRGLAPTLKAVPAILVFRFMGETVLSL